MSYCVNCGVELSDNEKQCPLCNVEVINPKTPWEEPAERPYSHHFETLMKRIDRRYFATLAGLLLVIPVVITLMYDIVSGDGISWSAYVVGAVALLFIFVVFPFYFKKYNTVIFLSVDCAVIMLYLLFIERMNGGHWFVGTGLPITAIASVGVIVLALLFKKKKRFSFLQKTAFIMIAAGIFVVCLEQVISLNTRGVVGFGWSFYVLIPCLLLSIAAFILEHRRNLKEQIRRRLFY